MNRFFAVIISISMIVCGLSITASAGNLSNVSLDDGTQLSGSFAEGYTVTLKAGHPRIPKIVCHGADEIYQGFIPTYEKEGLGKVVVDGTQATIKFIKDSSKGFVLQYDDRFKYDFGLTGTVTYTSTDNSVVSASNGVLTAHKVSATPVTITATNGTQQKQLVIDEVIKAPLNIFMISGQSNAYGADANRSEAVIADEGTCYSWADTNYFTKSTSGSSDISQYVFTFDTFSKQGFGFSPALAKEWYEKTGEKVVLVQTARGSTTISQWLPDYVETQATYLNAKCNLYHNAINRFNSLVELINSEDKFEINRKGYFWYQGENDTQAYGIITDYMNNFKVIHQGFKSETGVEFCGIYIPRFCLTDTYPDQSDKLDGTRVAMYELDKQLDDLFIASNEPEVLTTDKMNINSWNMIHHSQKTYNELGKEGADNVLANLNAKTDRSVKDINIYYDNTLFKQNENDLSIESHGSHDMLVLVTPSYARDKNVQLYDKKGTAITLGENVQGVQTISFNGSSSIEDSLTYKVGSFEKTFSFKNSYEKIAPTASYYSANNTICVKGTLGSSYANKIISVMLVDKDASLANIPVASIKHIGIIQIKNNGKYYYTFPFDGSLNDYRLILKNGNEDLTNSLDICYAEKSGLFDLSLGIERVSNSTYYHQTDNVSTDTFGNAVVTVENPHMAEIDCTLILSFYDYNGHLISMASTPITTTADKEFVEKIKIPGDARKVKAYIWKNTEGIQIMSNFDILERN